MNTIQKSVWLLVLVMGLSFLCGAVPLPPRKVKRVDSTRLTKGAGAVALLAPAAFVVPTRTNLTIAWDFVYDEDNTPDNIVFNVRQCKTNRLVSPSTNWPIVGVTTQWRHTVAIDPTVKCCWLSVTASNTVSKLESGFSRK